MNSAEQNVDLKEIEHFASLAQTWWDPEGEFKTLHQINPLRLNYIEDQVGGLFGLDVLDLGCGGGVLSESMAKRQAQVTGIDMGAEQIQVAKLHALETQTTLDYQQTSAEQMALENPARFDLITCMEMLEHVPDPSSVIAACKHMLKPGGRLVVSTINRTFASRILMIEAAEKILKIVPKGTHQHAKFIRPSELLTWCDAQGLLCDDIKGVSFIPWIERLSLSRNVDVNYMLSLHLPKD
ncbi:bifunctional 2-polyprenyl-6-hydroxyphenol methylase/3-demethylubiquinol 3-O-methyltransferase UbiG [Alginatibacterium sediminis]|uniref:Ubiquinone biosynthesis O-methyltransferase n=1 Tax=Alginatibacterium sediminis TaxID=2164068 RepID=A0A420EBS4_9ALTE|nr:bifunctional 2-polyprenyl-6-hydroxyphenol methylase/3-demethylubiquinol 3-O-methyltransferase UbiG [Alginatibacterium sediminis]RKF18126.1 bifunctional 2-polyprenyl-6-hydroxyphenol methylase/3-demethylubiquinol 3-O-methyltransferase UbiG [Alginatibacterium sediminis]